MARKKTVAVAENAAEMTEIVAPETVKCKVVYKNVHTKVIGFEHDGIGHQTVAKDGFDWNSDYIEVIFTDDGFTTV